MAGFYTTFAAETEFRAFFEVSPNLNSASSPSEGSSLPDGRAVRDLPPKRFPQFRELDFPQRLILGKCPRFPLTDSQPDILLVVSGGGEYLGLLHGNGRIAPNDVLTDSGDG